MNPSSTSAGLPGTDLRDQNTGHLKHGIISLSTASWKSQLLDVAKDLSTKESPVMAAASPRTDLKGMHEHH